MRHPWRITLMMAMLFAAPAQAASDSDDAFVLGSTGQKFFALPDRTTSAPVKVLRSDRDAMQKGFMALDRNRVTVPRAATNPVAVQTGNDGDILSLFGNGITQPSASPLGVSHGWPLPANAQQYISSGYGTRKDPFHGKIRFHGGVDIAAPAGTPVLATADGIVTETGYRAGLGNYVTIRHADGSESMYNHLQQADARRGNSVRKGQAVGKLGSTGRSTGPHLDYRLTKNGARIDPMTVLAGKQPSGVSTVASGASRASAQIITTNNGVRTQKGVRIITPQQRVALSGGIIKVR